MDYKEIKKRDRDFGKEPSKFDMRLYTILVVSVTAFILAIAAAVYFFGKDKAEPVSPPAVTETAAPEATPTPTAEELPEIGG